MNLSRRQFLGSMLATIPAVAWASKLKRLEPAVVREPPHTNRDEACWYCAPLEKQGTLTICSLMRAKRIMLEASYEPQPEPYLVYGGKLIPASEAWRLLQ